MLSIIALRGISSFLLTTIHHLDPGIAPSRAKAQTQRDAAVVHPIPHIVPRIIRGIRRAKAIPGDPTALLIIGGSGWLDVIKVEMSGKTKTMGMRKRRPTTKLKKTVATRAFGIWTEGCCTSSHILYSLVMWIGQELESTYDMIIPVAEVP